jgi:hypothetical protein
MVDAEVLITLASGIATDKGRQNRMGVLGDSAAAALTLSDLLDEQYEAVLAYCNSQISLYNAIHSKHDRQGEARYNMKSVLRSYSDALAAVRSNLRNLHELSETLPRSQQKLLVDHLDRMDHVLNLVGGQPLVHPNGVPTSRAIDTDSFTLALSSTRASIRLVKEATR